MSSQTHSEFPGEDFFHPGFTPAEKSQPAIVETTVPSSHEQPRLSVVTRKPVASLTPRLNPLSMNPISEDPYPGQGLAPSSQATTRTSSGGMLTASPHIRPVSGPSSAHGDSNSVSANSSHPSPPAAWPVVPHIQTDYASSQLHGSDLAEDQAQPVSPISDSDYFNSAQASRANSLAYRVSQRTVRQKAVSPGGNMPPLLQEDDSHLGVRPRGDGDDSTTAAQTSPEFSAASSSLPEKAIRSPPASQLRAPNTEQQMFGPQRASQQYQPAPAFQQQPPSFLPYRASHPNPQAPVSKALDPTPSNLAGRPHNDSQQSRYSAATMTAASPFVYLNDNEHFFTPEPKGRRTETDDFTTTNRLGPATAGSGLSSFRSSWLPEILWISLSVACIGVIAVLLSRYNHTSVSQFPLPITLNVLLAFIVTICHIALIFPVMEGTSQLKWNWFSTRDRSLADFQVFEDASKGPIGTFKLLIATKGFHLHLLAFLFMVLSLLTSAMTQMTIGYSTCLTASCSKSDAVRAVSYENAAGFSSSGASTVLGTLQKQSIQNGIYNPPEVAVKSLRPECGAAGCPAQTPGSLAVCVSTEDVSQKLEITEQVSTDTIDRPLGLDGPRQVRWARLANGAYLLGSADTFNANITSQPLGSSAGQGVANTTIAFSNQPKLITAAIANTFIVYTKQASFEPSQTPPPVSDTAFGAMEILLHFCVARYDVNSGSEVQQQALPFEARTEQRAGRQTVVLSEGGNEYSIDVETAAPLARYTMTILSGTFSASLGPSVIGYTGTADAFGTAMYGSASRQLVEAGRIEAVRNVTRNVATSLSNAIRAPGSQTPGTPLEHDTYISIRWGWLAFLVVQVMLAAGFLGGTMWQTSRLGVRVLKSSALAGMFAVSADDKRLLEQEGICTVQNGHSMARAMKASGIRGRFVGGGGDGGGDRVDWAMDLGVR